MAWECSCTVYMPLLFTSHLSQFVEERDGCALPFQKPVYELLAGKLWPVVCIEKVSLLAMLCCQVEGAVSARERGGRFVY